MSKSARQGGPERRPAKGAAKPAQRNRPAVQIVLRRLWQGCYGTSGGSFLAFVAVLLGDDPPPLEFTITLLVLLAIVAATGVVLEITERHFFPGGEDDG